MASSKDDSSSVVIFKVGEKAEKTEKTAFYENAITAEVATGTPFGQIESMINNASLSAPEREHLSRFAASLTL